MNINSAKSIIKQGQTDFDPDINPKDVCPYRGDKNKHYYFIGWNKSEKQYKQNKLKDKYDER